MTSRSISKHLTVLIMGALILSGVLAELVAVSLDFRKQLSQLDVVMDDVLAAAIPTAAQAAFQFDPVFAQRSVESIMKNPFVIDARIQSDFGDLLAGKSRAAQSSWSQGITAALVDRFQHFEVPLKNLDDENIYGRLNVSIDADTWLAPYYDRSTTQIAIGAVRSFVMSIIALAIFRSVLQRPIMGFLRSLNHVSPSDPEPLGLVVGHRNKDNELGALNQRVDAILTSSQKHQRDRERAFREVTRRDDRIRSILQNLPAVLFRYSTENPGKIDVEYQSIVTRPEVGQSWHDIPVDRIDLDVFIYKDDLADIQEKLNSRPEDGAAWSWTGRVNQQDGGPGWFRAAATAQEKPDGTIVWHGIALDISGEIELQERLAQSQKIEAIGQLTGGIGHDFNNLLAIMYGNLEMLLMEAEDGFEDRPLAQELLHSTLSAARRGSELTKNLLAYARKSNLDPEPLNVSDTLSEAASWLKRSIPENIKFHCQFEPAVWAVVVDKHGLQNAIVNLVINARDAMPDGGHITLKTENTWIEQPQDLGAGEFLARGEYVRVSCKDTGIGIAKEDQLRIFEPFHTTKPAHKGSGLGLSMVHGFMHQNGGAVSVSSKLGAGTTFDLYLPASTTEPISAVPSPIMTNIAGAKTGLKVLLVEDEIGVLMVNLFALSREGYAVSTAQSGDEALYVFDKDGPFDIVITDVVMPGTLQGPMLVTELRKTHPNLPVILLSGYSSELMKYESGVRPDDPKLIKPVPRAELLSAIQSVLGVSEEV